MGKEQTNCSIDGKLKEEALKRNPDFNFSDILEEAIRKKLNLRLSLEEVNEKLLEHLSAISELEARKEELLMDIRFKKDKENIKNQEVLEKEELAKKNRLEKLNILYNSIPEAQSLNLDMVKDSKFLIGWVDAMRLKYPDKRTAIQDVRDWLISKSSQNIQD